MGEIKEMTQTWINIHELMTGNGIVKLNYSSNDNVWIEHCESMIKRPSTEYNMPGEKKMLMF